MSFTRIFRNLQRNLPAYIAFFLGLAVTGAAYLLHGPVQHLHIMQKARAEAEEYGRMLERGVSISPALSQSLAAYVASSPALAHGSFRVYAQTMRPEKVNPGVWRLDYVPKVDLHELENFEMAAQQEQAGFSIKTTTSHMAGSWFPILYSYLPHLKTDGRLVGLNMASIPAARAAMQRALQTGQAAATSKILVRDAGNYPSGFAIYTPVFRPGLPIETPDKRQTALLGFAVSVFRFDTLIQEALGSGFSDNFYLVIRDNQEMLFGPSFSAEEEAPMVASLKYMQVADRKWNVAIYPTSAYFSLKSRNLDILIVLGGLLFSIMIARAAKRQQARRRRAQMQAEQSQRLQSIFEHHRDAVYSLDKSCRFSSVNDKTLHVLGLNRQQVIGFHFMGIVHPQDRARVQTIFSSTLAGESSGFELKIVNARKQEIILNVANIPIYIDGQISGIWGIAEDVSERRRTEERMAYMAHHDSLTGLANRTLFYDRMTTATARAKRHGTMAAILYLDIDRFKQINDTLGHEAGDTLLKLFAQRVKSTLRATDTIARLGGDEFAVILEDLDRPEYAATVAEKIISAMQAEFQLGGKGLNVFTSIGVAVYQAEQSIDEWLRKADAALYQAKHAGRNQFRISGKGNTSTGVPIAGTPAGH